MGIGSSNLGLCGARRNKVRERRLVQPCHVLRNKRLCVWAWLKIVVSVICMLHAGDEMQTLRLVSECLLGCLVTTCVFPFSATESEALLNYFCGRQKLEKSVEMDLYTHDWSNTTAGWVGGCDGWPRLHRPSRPPLATTICCLGSVIILG